MKLKLICLGLLSAVVYGFYLMDSHWKATRHELYQAWDSTEELRGAK